jgi:LemA protein
MKEGFGFKPWMIFAGLGVIVGLWLWSSYNSVVSMQEDINRSWAQVENVYKRRADLLPQLTKVVKATAQNEKDIINGAIELRSKATSINIDASKMTPEQMKEFLAVQDKIGGSLGKLLAVAEAYPEIKSNESFLKLQDEVAGSDNRIATERMRFNEVVGAYNAKIRRFPVNLLGFTTRPYFEIEEKDTEVPDLNL